MSLHDDLKPRAWCQQEAAGGCASQEAAFSLPADHFLLTPWLNLGLVESVVPVTSLLPSYRREFLLDI